MYDGQNNPSNDDQESNTEDKKDQNEEDETDASLDSDYEVDEYRLDEQLVDTNFDQQKEQILQKKNISDLNLDYKIFTSKFDEITE